MSKLFGEDGYAVETVVAKSDINMLIPALKDARRDRHPRAADRQDRPVTVTGEGRSRRSTSGAGSARSRADDGTVYPFHCTVIADGTRTIAVGAAVEFEVVPGHLGRWEAAAVRPPRAGR